MHRFKESGGNMTVKKSIITDDLEHCYICGSPYIHIHHIFYGTANRKISDHCGCIVPLCQAHHTGNKGVHFDRDLDLFFKRLAQVKIEKQSSREEFINLFGQSYL